MTPQEIRLRYSLRDATTINKLQFFADAHLHPNLKGIVSPIRELAFILVDDIEDGEELLKGLDKLIEAKDCFIRHHLIVNKFQLPHQR